MNKAISCFFVLLFFSACQLFEPKKDAKPAQDITQYNVPSDAQNAENANVGKTTSDAVKPTKTVKPNVNTPKKAQNAPKTVEEVKTTPKVTSTDKIKEEAKTKPSIETKTITKTPEKTTAKPETPPSVTTAKTAPKTTTTTAATAKDKVPTAASDVKKPTVQVTAKGVGLIPQSSALPISFNTQMLTAVNALRKSGTTCGGEKMPSVKALIWNNKLEKASVVHVEDMDATNHFSHAGTDGSLPDDRIKAAGYNWERVGENIGSGYKDVPAAIKGWKESTNHCKQMMSADVTEMGAAKKGKYWCQAFAKPLD